MAKESIKNKVAVVGAGMIPFGELYDKSFGDMISEAYLSCLDSVDKGIDPSEIDAMWYGTINGPQTGAELGETLGLSGIPSTHVENACATGSDTFRNACLAVASGSYDVALVVAAEKMLDRPGGLIEAVGQQPTQFFWSWGVTMPTAFALWSTRHFHEYGTSKEHLAKIASKNHHYGKMNEYSHYRREVSVEKVLDAPMVAWPFGLYDCCPITDGAAATIVVKEELAEEYTDSPVYVLGNGLATQPINIHLRESFTSMSPTRWAAEEAYEMAGIGPEDIDFAELHDCFTGTEMLTYEDLGFCEKGKAGEFIDNEEMKIDGKTPCNISGGLKSHGHPVGATGNAQIVELFWQLREEVEPDRQVPEAEIGLQHNIGGMGPQVSCVNILSNKKV